MTREYFMLLDYIYMGGTFFRGVYTNKEESEKDMIQCGSGFETSNVEKIKISTIDDLKKLVSTIHSGSKDSKFKVDYSTGRFKYNLNIQSKKLHNLSVSSTISEADLLVKAMLAILKLRF